MRPDLGWSPEQFNLALIDSLLSSPNAQSGFIHTEGDTVSPAVPMSSLGRWDGAAGQREEAAAAVPRSLLERWGWYSGPHGGSCGPTP